MKKIILSGILAISLGFIGGCGQNSENEKSIIIGTPSRIKKLDPMVSNDIPSLLITNQIFDTFFYYENSEIKSKLLDTFSFENDKLILTPKKDLKFSNGELVTIEDFKLSFDRALKHPGCKFLIGNIENIAIQNEQIVISFYSPTPSILNNLTYPMVVLLKETTNGLVGTGAFKLYSEDVDNIKLSPNIFSKNVGKQSIIFRAIPEDNARTMALEAEEISINTNVPPVDKKLILSKGIEVIQTPSVTTEMIWFNNQKLNLEERKKISKAINKKDII
ncbi:MAG: ABC transporter substrate-binding protein, partial [Cetobacterium sp.]